jgi:hypothetical protein
MRALVKLYSDQALVTNLEDFTTRFSNRYLQMPLDKNIPVAVLGLRLLRLLDVTYVLFGLSTFSLSLSLSSPLHLPH